jgi:PAS domain S-box-containing protein
MGAARASTGDTAATPHPADAPPRRSKHVLLRDLAVGLMVPPAIAFVVRLAAEPRAYRPGAVLLTAVTVIAVLVGFRAALVATLTSSVVVWWAFTNPADSFGIASAGEGLSLAIFMLGAGMAVVLVERVTRARESETAERELVTTLLDEAPIGVALFDTDARFRRVNRRLASMNGIDVEDHLGRQPRQISADAGELYQHLIEQVVRTGEPLTDVHLDVVRPELGIERHWRAGYYPVRGADGSLTGVGATVDEVTEEVLARQRSEQLLRLTESLTGVGDIDGWATAVARFLGEAFGGRVAVALLDDSNGRLEIRAATGYEPSTRERYRAVSLPLSTDSPLTASVRTGEWVTVSSAADYSARFPGTDADRSLIGDRSCTTLPLCDPFEPGRSVGALHLAWPTEHELTASAATLLQTVASVAELALSRVQLSLAAQEDRFRGALDAMLDNVSIVGAVRDDDGTIVDFELEFVNRATLERAGRSSEEMVGRRVSELYPNWRASGVADLLTRVVETGEPLVRERLAYHDELPDGRVINGWRSVRAARFGDGYIAASRDVTDEVLAEEAAHAARELAERERIAVELLQRAALPVDLPSLPGVTLGARYQPANPLQPVGGDWYDAFPLDEHSLALVIADVAGHGEDAAAFMLQVRNVLRALSIQERDPATVLTRSNMLTRQLQPEGCPFITCCLVVLEPATGDLRWASAGHFPPLVVGEAVRWAEGRPGLPLGAYDDATYESASLHLASETRLVLFTDGLVERRDEPLDVSLERLRAELTGRRGVPPQLLADQLSERVTDPFDDLAVLVIGSD